MKIEIKELLDSNTIRITTPDERWYQKPNTDIWLPSSTWISDYCPKGYGFYKWLASKGWNEAEAIKVMRGDRGTIVHNAIEHLIQHGEVGMEYQYPDSDGNLRELTADEYECVMSFHKWDAINKPQYIEIEKSIFNYKYGYAGTRDIKCLINDILWIIDIKTSNEIYLSHKAQISSYLHADGEEAKHAAILQVGYNKNNSGFKFTEIPDKFHVFLSAMEFWKEDNEGEQPQQKDYPRILKLERP